MRFFTGALVSSLIFSPVSVLSMVLDMPPLNSVTQLDENSTQPRVAAAFSPRASSLQKRFCLGRCSKDDGSGYQCRKKFFDSYQIKKSKDAACSKIKENKQKNPFPSLHTAFSFDTPGPYVEWPIKRNGRFWNKWSKSRYRIVLTEDCKVVGAVIRKKGGRYSKCNYVDDERDD